MKGPVALLLCTVITAVAFSAPLHSEKETARWRHPIRDEFLSPRGNANRLEIFSSLPRSSYISHPDNHFLCRRKSTSQQIEDSKHMLLQMIQDFSDMNGVVSMSAPSRNKASLQFRDLFNSKQSSSVSSLPTRGSTLRQIVEYMMSSNSEDSLQNSKEIDQLIHDVTEKCIAPFTHHITNLIKLGDNFGFNDPLLAKLLELTTNYLNIYINRGTSNNEGTFINLFSDLINLIDGLSNANAAGSEKLVQSEQLARSDDRALLDQLLRLIVAIVGNNVPNSTERDGTNSFNSILGDLAMFFSGPIKSERTLKFINNSVNFLLMQLDNTDFFTWGDNYREAIKSFANSAVPVLFNNLRGLDSTREERMNLLKSMVKIAFAAFNIETIDIDKVFQLLFSSEESNEEINAELQPLVDFIFQSISTVLKDVTNGGIFIDEEGCGGAAREVIRLIFTYLPGLLDTDGDKRGKDESHDNIEQKFKVHHG